jgi:ABC-type Zn uptake system ZnuABC Zn-binding protein ZnuA
MTLGKLLRLSLIAAFAAAACASPGSRPAASTGLKVVATTTIVGDVVKAVGGDAIELSVMLPIGADPHSFEATPQDVARVAQADVVFVNGVGLEEFLEPLIENAGGQAQLVSVSENLPPLEFEGEPEHGDERAEDGDAHGVDPHVWFDPANVMIWVDNIQRALSALDTANAGAYAANAAAYKTELEALHIWIKEQVAAIPSERRLLVTNHDVFGYFAARYGFMIVASIFPAGGADASPSAQTASQLVATIKAAGVKAVFSENTLNPDLADTIAREAGVKIVSELYTDSLGPADSPAATYIGLMRFDVQIIVEALK